MEFKERPDWDSYFMKMAHLAAERSTCGRRQVGAVIVKDHNILATGYNGSPSGTKHCKETGCLREQLNVPSGEKHEICRGAHAEQNAIAQAAKHGTSINDATIYCTNMLCIICAKLVINAGIRRVVFEEGYGDDLSMEMLKDVEMEILQLSPKN